MTEAVEVGILIKLFLDAPHALSDLQPHCVTACETLNAIFIDSAKLIMSSPALSHVKTAPRASFPSHRFDAFS